MGEGLDSNGKSDLVTQWDVTRRTAEFFDKSINDNRKIFLTFTLAMATAAAAISDKVENGSPNTVLMAFTTAIVGLSMIYWGLEFHNGQYLRITAITAWNIEEGLGAVKKNMGVSAELFSYRERRGAQLGSGEWLVNGFSADNFAYLIYPGVALTAIIVASVINYNGGVFFHFEYVVWTVSLVVIIEVISLMLYMNNRLFTLFCERKYNFRNKTRSWRLGPLATRCSIYNKYGLISLLCTDAFLTICIFSPSLRFSLVFFALIAAVVAKFTVTLYFRNLITIRYVYESAIIGLDR